MSGHRNLLLKVEVRAAGKLSHCKHNKKHPISKGQLRFVLKLPGPGAPEYGYCLSCAQEMVAQAEARLSELRTELQQAAAD